MQKLIALLVVVCFVAATPVLAREHAGIKVEFGPGSWEDLSPKGKEVALLDILAYVERRAGKEGIEDLNGVLNDYPFEGIGITYGPVEEKEGTKIFVFRVLAVFRDSPAFRIGIRPGDELISVNGRGVCMVLPVPSSTPEPRGHEKISAALMECSKQIQNTFKEARGTFKVKVERPAGDEEQSLVFSLQKESVGGEIHAFVRYYLPAWKRELKRVRKETEKVRKYIKEVGDNPAALAYYYEWLSRLAADVERPQALLQLYVSQWQYHLLPMNKQ